MLRSVEGYTFFVDADAGDFFLNFNLHPNVQRFAGVDFSLYLVSDSHEKIHEVWKRAGMGLKSSPYQAVQMMALAEEMIRGSKDDEDNPFRWDNVRMNLPGSPDYDPSLPWVAKIRVSDGKVAADLVINVDDLRIMGPSLKEAWLAAHRTCSIMGHLGIQDAARKRRECSQTPGAWAGSVVRILGGSVFVLVSEEKWNKMAHCQ